MSLRLKAYYVIRYYELPEHIISSDVSPWSDQLWTYVLKAQWGYIRFFCYYLISVLNLLLGLEAPKKHNVVVQ